MRQHANRDPYQWVCSPYKIIILYIEYVKIAVNIKKQIFSIAAHQVPLQDIDVWPDWPLQSQQSLSHLLPKALDHGPVKYFLS